MKTFLIKYVLSINQYMEIGSKKQDKTILVEAENEEKAIDTLKKYWENKTDSYGTYYSIYEYEVIPTISQTELL